MSRKFLYYSLIAILLLIVILGVFFVKTSSKSDAIKFKEEYEKYNDTNLKLTISKNNPFVYRSEDKIIKILNNNTGMIFLGNAKSDEYRQVLKTIMPLADSNEVKKIFYLDIDKITDKKLKEYKNSNVCIIFVISGEVITTYTTDDFKDDNIKKEINYYMQQTFNDYCDETCDD